MENNSEADAKKRKKLVFLNVLLVNARNLIDSERPFELDSALPDCCTACKIKLAGNGNIICVFYNPPDCKNYRYTKKDFEAIATGFPETNQLLICCDIHFYKTDWETPVSSDEFEQEIADLFEANLLEQAIDFNTRGHNLPDIALHRNCSVNAESRKLVTRICDCSDQSPDSLLVECPHVDAKPIIENFRILGNADYTQVNEILKTKTLEETSYSNINRMSEEKYHYFEKLIDICLSRRTHHQQFLLPWVSLITSNLQKRLETRE